MSNYIPHYRKKIYLLERKKEALKRLLGGQWTEEELAIAAQAVRESQIRVFEAKKAQIAPVEANTDLIHAIDMEIEVCKRLSVTEIVKTYGH